MAERHTHSGGGKAGPGRSRRRLLMYALAFVIIAGVVIMGLFSIPEMIRTRVVNVLSGLSEGPVEVGDIGIRVSGLINLRDVSFRDRTGDRWLHLDSAKITLGNWPSMNPVVEEIEADGVQLRVSAKDGRFRVPVRRHSDKSAGSAGALDLNRIALTNAAVTITDDRGPDIKYDKVEFLATKADSSYEFKLSRDAGDSPGVLEAQGTLNPRTLEADISLKLEHALSGRETALISAAIKNTDIAAEGRIDGELTIAGCLKKPQTLKPVGSIRLSDWLVAVKNSDITNTINATIRLDGTEIRFEDTAVRDANALEWFAAKTANLTLDNWPGPAPVLTALDIEAMDLHASYVDGRLSIPFQWPTSRTEGSKNPYIDIRRMGLRDASINVTDPNGARLASDHLSVQAVRQNGSYDIELKRLVPGDPNTVSVTGSLDPKTLQAELSVKAALSVRKDQAAFVLAALKVPDVSAEGRLEADLAIAGCLKKPETLEPAGTLRLDGCVVTLGGPPSNVVSGEIMVDGPSISLADVAVSDANGIEWFTAGAGDLKLNNWPGPRPVLTELSLDRMNLRVAFVDRGLRIPLNLPSGESGKSAPAFVDLEKLTLRDASLTATDPNGSTLTLEGLTAEAVRRQDSYDIMVRHLVPDDPNTILVKGALEPDTLCADLMIQFKRDVQAPEMSLVLNAIGVSGLSARGRLDADLKVSGCLKEPEKLKPAGSVQLNEWVVTEEHTDVSNTLNSRIVLDGPEVRLEDFAVCDAAGRRWLAAAKAAAILSGWPGAKPAVREIDIDGLNLQISFAQGRFAVPFTFPLRPRRASTDKAVPLDRLTIRDATVGVTDSNGLAVVFDSLSAEALRRPQHYDLSLERLVADDPNTVLLKGTFDPATSHADISFKLTRDLDRPQASLLFAALGAPSFSGAGRVEADLTVVGNLKEPASARYQGAAELKNCLLTHREGLVVSNLTTLVKASGNRFDFSDMKASCFNGRLDGSFYAAIDPNRPVQFGGRLLAVNVDMPQLTAALSHSKRKAAKGTLTMSYDFSMAGADVNSLRGDGLVLLNDADVSILPVIPQVFAAIGLSAYEPLKMSDAEGQFTNIGPAVKIKIAHIANSFAAVEAEPGGTVNLRTRHIDMHVIGSPLKHIDMVMKRLPVVDIFAGLKDKLTRLYVRGQWSDPPAKLITKKPIQDITEGTVGFLRDVVENGGQFGRSLLDGLGVLLGGRKEKKQ